MLNTIKMIRRIIRPNSVSLLLIITFYFASVSSYAQKKPIQAAPQSISWKVGEPIFTATGVSTVDNVSVKDPSIVYHHHKWHLFYTAIGSDRQLHIGYASARKLSGLQKSRRTMLNFSNLENPSHKYAAPQVFYFEPQQLWYLVFQGYWNNVQPLYATTDHIEDPSSWTQPKPLMPKFEQNAWVDFYVICDSSHAYLSYSRDYRSVYCVRTRIEDFPEGFDYQNPIMLIDDKNVEFGEAAHIYSAKGMDEYHMVYEISDLKRDKIRYYSLYSAPQIAGPWRVKYPVYASMELLKFESESPEWPEEVSHGEMIRTNYTQSMEYDPGHTQFLMQGIISSERGDHYTPENYWMLPWKLGIIETKVSESH